MQVRALSSHKAQLEHSEVKASYACSAGLITYYLCPHSRQLLIPPDKAEEGRGSLAHVRPEGIGLVMADLELEQAERG